jgi:hypothetical protein
VAKMTQENTNDINLMQTEDKGKVSPPYISFLTFNNMITWLETEGVPVKFDRSFWGKKYGGTLGLQLMAGLRFLGLLKGDYTQTLLGDIVNTKSDDRKKLLAKMIQQAYSAVDFSQLPGATPNMLKEWFSKYNLDGSTDRKARSFFVNACKYYDVPISNSLKKTARNKQVSTAREKKSDKDKPVQENKNDKIVTLQTPIVQPEKLGKSEQQDLFKIILSDGCELKLCSDRVYFEISKTDRQLVESIVELMKQHRKN